MITYKDFNVEIFSAKIAYLKTSSINCDKLAKECLDYKSVSNTVKKSNQGGWQSDSIVYNEIDKQKYTEYVKLVYLLENILLSFSRSIDGPDLLLDNIWININGKNSFNWPHTHPASILSGIFYVQVPANCDSNLVFENILYDSSHWHNFILKSDFLNKDNSNSSLYSQYFISPSAGDIILFPSYLSHLVTPNNSSEERISIAFNTFC